MRIETASKLKIIVLSISVLILSQIFIAGLSISLFQKSYLNFLTSSIELVGKEFKREIELAIRYGKSFNKFLGMEQLMEEIKTRNKDIMNIVIFETDGKILYNLEDKSSLSSIPEPLRIDFDKATKAQKINPAILYNGNYNLLIPVNNQDKKWIGTISLSFSENIVKSEIKKAFIRSAELLAIITIGSTILLAILLSTLVSFKTDRALPKRKITWIVAIVLVITQLFYSAINGYELRQSYIDITRSKIQILTDQLRENIERVLDKGVAIDRLVKIDKVFDKIIEDIPEIAEIAITDTRNIVLYRSAAEHSSNLDIKDSPTNQSTVTAEYEIIFPLEKQVKSEDRIENITEGYMKVTLSKRAIKAIANKIFIDTLTVILTSLLFLLELMIFLLIYITTKMQGHPTEDEGPFTYMLVRPVAFTFLFAVSLSMSFIPLQMNNIYAPMFGLSKEIVLALPISVEMLCAMLTTLAAGFIIDKRGWHVPFLTGICLSAAGAFFSGATVNPFEFIAARGIAGLGYGFSWMAIYGYVYKHTALQFNARGISNLVAGIISGQICGTAVGAMLAEQIGYSSTFKISSILVLIPVIFIIIFMKSYLVKPEITYSDNRLGIRDFLSYITDRNIISILLLIRIPFSVCQIGLLNYAAPIYLNSIDIAQSNIGRVLMIHGLSIVCIAPFLSHFIDHSETKKLYVALGGIIGGLGLTLLYFESGLLAIMFAIFILGLASSSGSAQSAFTLKLDVVHSIGSGKAMSIQRTADKLGQMLGPIFIGIMITVAGFGKGIALSGMIFILTSIIFIFSAKEKKLLSSQ